MKRLYYCWEGDLDDDDGGIYYIETSANKAKARHMGYADEYINIRVHVLAAFDQKVKELKLPCGETDEYEKLGIDTSMWEVY